MSARAEAESMASTRTALSGRTGWSAVVGLATVLVVLVTGQLPAASAGDRALQPVAAVTGPVAFERTAVTSAADRLPGPIRATALREQVARKAATTPPARPAAAPPAAAGLCAGEGWQQRRGQAALASLKPGALDRTGFRVEFKGARQGYMGLTHLKQRRIEMFVRACGTQSDELLRHVMAHELGHAFDTVHMTARSRAAYQATRGIPAGTPWYGCSACTDFATPAGDFAEVYAQWARGASTNRSQLAGDVPPGQLAAVAQQFFGA